MPLFVAKMTNYLTEASLYFCGSIVHIYDTVVALMGDLQWPSFYKRPFPPLSRIWCCVRLPPSPMCVPVLELVSGRFQQAISIGYLRYVGCTPTNRTELVPSNRENRSVQRAVAIAPYIQQLIYRLLESVNESGSARQLPKALV